MQYADKTIHYSPTRYSDYATCALVHKSTYSSVHSLSFVILARRIFVETTNRVLGIVAQRAQIASLHVRFNFDWLL